MKKELENLIFSEKAMNKVALITGGSRGIGLGIAMELAKAGFDLAINGVREEHAVSGTIEDLKKYGGEVIYVQGDVSLNNERERILSRVLAPEVKFFCPA